MSSDIGNLGRPRTRCRRIGVAGIRRGIDVLDERHHGVRSAPGDRRVGLADLGAEEPEPVPADRDEDGDEGIRALLR